MSREAQAQFAVSAEDDARGEALVRCAAMLQYSLPGIPVIYYGDEAGLHGLLDPFNRGTFPAEAFGEGGAAAGEASGGGELAEGEASGGGAYEGSESPLENESPAGGTPGANGSHGDGSLAEWYRALSALRSARAALRTGGALYYSTNGDVIGVLRYCLDGADAFGAPAADEVLLTVVNPDPEPRRIVIDLHAEKECLSFEHLALIRAREPTRAVRLLSSREDGAGGASSALPITSGLLDLSVPPFCAEIFEIGWERG
jgi:glycosidase